MIPFHIPTRAEISPILTPSDRAEMLSRALKTCADIGDDDAVIAHLRRCNIDLVPIAGILFAAIDEARAAKEVAK